MISNVWFPYLTGAQLNFLKNKENGELKTIRGSSYAEFESKKFEVIMGDHYMEIKLIKIV